MARKALDELLKDRKNIELETVEIITNPLTALKNGIKMIPALQSGENTLSGIFLSRDQIEQFLNKAEQS